jgi:hypothetical protein
MDSTYAYETMTGTSMAAPMVSGVISQFLHEFKNRFIEAGRRYREEGMNDEITPCINKIVALEVLKNARKTHLHNGQRLPNEFGAGVLNYEGAKKGILERLRVIEDHLTWKLAERKAEEDARLKETAKLLIKDGLLPNSLIIGYGFDEKIVEAAKREIAEEI